MTFIGNCRATGIGSLPLTDPVQAVEVVLQSCPDLPYWPQLPRLGRAEGMVEQAIARLPGVRTEGGRLRLVQDEDFYLAVERLFEAYANRDSSVAALTPDTAAGFSPFVEAVAARRLPEAKGQLAGPITVGMAVLGEDGRPILYDDVLREVLLKFLNLRVRWQAERIRAAGAAPIIFVDEPFLASYGTPFFTWGAEAAREALEAVVAGTAVTGSHCCSNTDWSIFLSSRLDVVAFDAYEFADKFLVYRDDLAAFLDRGGTICWGIVPTDPEACAAETVESLRGRLLGLVARVEAIGFRRDRVLRQSLLTPACGLGSRDPATADRAVALVRDLASVLRREMLGM